MSATDTRKTLSAVKDLRTPGHAWAHQCEICGEGAPFGCTDRHAGLHWFCSQHREEGERRIRNG
ncbi:hypothetical protein [Komagataeibacter melaceti]|nr:hypothetical protein [Komagataeibacter melaceti]